MHRFMGLALPSPRVEEWKYTNLAELASKPFGILGEDKKIDELVCSNVDEIDDWKYSSDSRLVFINGKFDATSSAVKRVPAGVTVTTLADALISHPDLVRSHMERMASFQNEALLALNTAYASSGLVILVDDGVLIDAPIELVFISSTRLPTVTHPRNLIIAGNGSRVTLSERFLGPDSAEYWSNSVMEIIIGQGAIVSHRKIQLESMSAFHIARTQVSLEEESSYKSFLASVGGHLSRNEIEIKFEGRNAECQLDGIYLAKDRQHVDITTRLVHSEEGGASRQVFKGVLDDRSRGVFQGLVSVTSDGKGTNGHQLNKTLLLSDKAEVSSKPKLEIQTDDVQCSHGATAGQLDEIELFYLRSRGLSIDEARDVLIRAFIAEVLDVINDESFEDELAHLVDNWLRLGNESNEEAVI